MMIRKSGNLPFVSTENNILLFSDHEVLVVRKKAVFNTACFVMPIFSDEVGIFYFTREHISSKEELIPKQNLAFRIYQLIPYAISPIRNRLEEFIMKKKLAIIMSLVMAVSMTACGNSADNTAEANTTAAVTESSTETTIDETKIETTSAAAEETTAETAEEAEEEDEEDYTTGDASLDNIRNQDEIGDNELLVLSFGTSFNDNRRLTIGAIENDIEAAFPDYSVRRGFSANIVIDHINRRDGFLIDDVKASLERAVNNGVKTLVVQPTHLMNGFEYNDIVEEVAGYADAFDKVVFGEPLLTSDDDFARVEKAITEWTAEYDDGETAICFMGHGTEADSNAVYQKMQDLLTADGYTNYFIGTVEAAPTLDDVLAKVQAGNYKRVVLEPLMVVAGDHANNDMASDEEDSWKTAFENAGYEVVCLIRGLGENEDIRQIYVDHAKAAIDSIAE